MTTYPIPTDEETKAALHAEDALFFRHILIEFVNQGAEICRATLQQVKAQAAEPAPATEPAPDYTLRFCRVSRSVRQSMMYAQKLTAPRSQTDEAGLRRVTARKQVIRQVEDAIHRDALAAEAGSLHAELPERIEGPEFDEDLDQLPTQAIVDALRADFGIRGAASAGQWKRRTPADIAILYDRAAAPCRAPVGPFVLPMPPRGWVDPDPDFEPVDAAESTARFRGSG
jgi:hypothetical protein